jgi:hypothetical protein
MNNVDATEYFNALVELLNSNDLGWVVNQVNEEIQSGKIVSNEFPIIKQDPFLNARQDTLFERGGEYRTRRRERFNQIVPFSQKERLILLIKALKRLAIDTSNIQKHVTAFVQFEAKKTDIKPDIRFYSEDTNADNFSLSRSESQGSQADIAKLEQLLTSLEHEVTNDNQE